MPGNFPVSKFKVELKLAGNRLRFLQQKEASLSMKARRDIATLLENGKDTSAQIRVESIIRDDLHIEAMEIVELFCELLGARAGLIDQSPTMDPGLAEPISSVIYASSRVDIRELPRIRDMLAAKYGKEMVKNAMDNADGHVNPKLLKKLSLNPPAPNLVRLYLKSIASAYRVDWCPDDSSDEGSPGGGVKEPVEAVEAKPLPRKEAGAEEEQSSPTADSAEEAKEAREGQDDSDNGGGGGSAELLPSPPVQPAKAPKPKVAEPMAAGGPAVRSKSPSPRRATPDPPSGDGAPTMEELQKRFDALKRL